MAVRGSKRALAEVARILGTDTTTARTWLRTVQHLAGPVPYDEIAAAMGRVEGHDPERVAKAITAGRADGDQPAPDRTVTDGE
jgi:hypothetical protein